MSISFNEGSDNDVNNDEGSDKDAGTEARTPSPRPPVEVKIICWCDKCVGIVSQHAYICEEHISINGRYNGGFPKASSSGLVIS
jgi:hypothetical protein